MHAGIHAYMHSRVHACLRECVNVYMCTHVHVHVHSCTHAQSHTYPYTLLGSVAGPTVGHLVGQSVGLVVGAGPTSPPHVSFTQAYSDVCARACACTHPHSQVRRQFDTFWLSHFEQCGKTPTAFRRMHAARPKLVSTQKSAHEPGSMVS